MSPTFDIAFGQELCDLLAVEMNLPCIFDGIIVAASLRERIGVHHDIGARVFRGEMDEHGTTQREATNSSGMREGVALAIDLGQWVLATACHQLHRWNKNPAIATLTMAVNVNIRQFRQRSTSPSMLRDWPGEQEPCDR